MINPQTTAMKFEHIEAIAKYGCCAFTALWICGIETDDDYEAIELLEDAIKSGALEKDCTVKWFDFFKQFTGRKIKVDFVNINKLSDLNKYIKTSANGRFAVRYDYKNNSHWVGVEKGKIAFNSLKHSNCVEYGKPTQARIISFA